MRKILLLEPAQRELDAAVAWYGEQAPGLGEAFLLEAVRAFDLVAQHPDAWHPMGESMRRCRLARFPYGIIYTQVEVDILVLAVAHLHRRPDYWRERWPPR